MAEKGEFACPQNCGKGPWSMKAHLVSHMNHKHPQPKEELAVVSPHVMEASSTLTDRVDITYPTTKPSSPPPPNVVHPDLVPKGTGPKRGNKARRTIVRVAKMVNPFADPPRLTQVPIEPSFNNRGTYAPGVALRHYLDKGFVLPYEFDPEQYPFLHCAVIDCWQPTMSGSERCREHEAGWQNGTVRYAISVKGQV